MSTDVKVFQTLFRYIDTAIDNYVTDSVSATIESISPMAHSLLIIYVALMGWSAVTGTTNEPITSIIVRAIKACGVYYFATNTALYGERISKFLYEWPSKFVAAITRNDADNTAQMLDGILSKGNALGTQAWELGGFDNLGAYIMAVLIYAMTWISTAITGILVATAKYGLALTLVIGPVFIIALLFEKTKHWFGAWLNVAVTEGLTIVLSVLATSLVFQLFNATLAATQADANANEGITTMPAIGALIIYGVAAIYAILKMPQLAASLGNGFSSASAGSLGATWNAGKRGAEWSGHGAKKGAQLAGRGAIMAYQKMRGNNSNLGKGGDQSRPRRLLYNRITGASRNRSSL